MADENREDKRNSKRYAIDYAVEVSPLEDRSFCDHAVLRDMSGGGVCFLSSQPDLYNIGQYLHLKVCLPDAANLGAVMEYKAKVAWIDYVDSSSSREEGGGFSVGVALEGFVAFDTRPLDS